MPVDNRLAPVPSVPQSTQRQRCRRHCTTGGRGWRYRATRKATATAIIKTGNDILPPWKMLFIWSHRNKTSWPMSLMWYSQNCCWLVFTVDDKIQYKIISNWNADKLIGQNCSRRCSRPNGVKPSAPGTVITALQFSLTWSVARSRTEKSWLKPKLHAGDC